MNRARKVWSAAALCVLAGVVVAVVRVGAFAAEAAPYAGAIELAQALRSADVECDDLQARPTATLVRDRAACASATSTLELYVFDAAGDRDNWLRVGARLGPVAIGPNWAVTGGAGDTERAARALHGRFEVPG